MVNGGTVIMYACEAYTLYAWCMLDVCLVDVYAWFFALTTTHVKEKTDVVTIGQFGKNSMLRAEELDASSPCVSWQVLSSGPSILILWEPSWVCFSLHGALGWHFFGIFVDHKRIVLKHCSWSSQWSQSTLNSCPNFLLSWGRHCPPFFTWMTLFGRNSQVQAWVLSEDTWPQVVKISVSGLFVVFWGSQCKLLILKGRRQKGSVRDWLVDTHWCLTQIDITSQDLGWKASEEWHFLQELEKFEPHFGTMFQVQWIQDQQNQVQQDEINWPEECPWEFKLVDHCSPEARILASTALEFNFSCSFPQDPNLSATSTQLKNWNSQFWIKITKD